MSSRLGDIGFIAIARARLEQRFQGDAGSLGGKEARGGKIEHQVAPALGGDANLRRGLVERDGAEVLGAALGVHAMHAESGSRAAGRAEGKVLRRDAVGVRLAARACREQQKRRRAGERSECGSHPIFVMSGQPRLSPVAQPWTARYTTS